MFAAPALLGGPGTDENSSVPEATLLAGVVAARVSIAIIAPCIYGAPPFAFETGFLVLRDVSDRVRCGQMQWYGSVIAIIHHHNPVKIEGIFFLSGFCKGIEQEIIISFICNNAGYFPVFSRFHSKNEIPEILNIPAGHFRKDDKILSPNRNVR
ncbi:MAG: hypothetical protein WC455_20090 [Dehalococcoidia bacterium]|jgi:hypothetical protein